MFLIKKQHTEMTCREEVLCDDPKELPKVYPLSKPLEKTQWYTAWRPQGIGSRPDM